MGLILYFTPSAMMSFMVIRAIMLFTGRRATTSGVLLNGIRPAEYPESYASGSILLSGVSAFNPAMIEFAPLSLTLP
jgi:hypothetical protein